MRRIILSCMAIFIIAFTLIIAPQMQLEPYASAQDDTPAITYADKVVNANAITENVQVLIQKIPVALLFPIIALAFMALVAIVNVKPYAFVLAKQREPGFICAAHFQSSYLSLN